MDFTISLYYVEGINEVDTPFFDTRAEQSTFFSSKLIKALSTSYYPPYYRNKIRFTSDDVNFNTSINYLSLDASDRKYYYFITDVTYITDGIIELTIDMDVIQTYYFDISIKHCCIERKFINRYTTEGNFNREYIRENVSQGHYLQGKSTYYNEKGWYVVRYNKSLSTKPLLKYGTNINVPSGSCTMFFPRDMKSCMVAGKTTEQSSELAFVRLLDDQYIDNISYVPFDFMNGKYTETNNIYNFSSTYYSMYNTETLSGSLPIKLYALTHLTTAYTTSVSFINVPYDWQQISILSLSSTKNEDTNVYFHSDFVPAMLDENYQVLLFGENSTYSILRAEYLQQPQVILKALVDLDSCNRIYGFTFKGNENIDEPSYNMVNSTNTSLDLTLVVSQYRSWMSQNKNQFIGAMINKYLL